MMRAKRGLSAVILSALTVVACNQLLGIEERELGGSGGSGAAASSSTTGSGGSAGGNSGTAGGPASSSSSAGGSLAGSGGTGGVPAGGAGGAGGEPGMGGMGGMGGMPSTDTCGTCDTASTAEPANVCAEVVGNYGNGSFFRFFDPACDANPTLDNCHPMGCAQCRFCVDPQNAGPNCDVCTTLDGTNCDDAGNQDSPTNSDGIQYCPPCVCEEHLNAIKAHWSGEGITLSNDDARALCPGNFDHCL